jgi:hypothetical protein
MLTVNLVLVGAAFLITLASASGKVPLWPAVLLLAIVHVLALLPQ